MIKHIIWRENRLFLLDQTLLPGKEKYIECSGYKQVAEAIKRLSVRGAPAIGIAGAFGLALAIKGSLTKKEFFRKIKSAGKYLVSTRPTAVNLAWGIKRVVAVAENKRNKELIELKRCVIKEALKIYEEEKAMERHIAGHGTSLFKTKVNILTHCNAGALATGGYGTAVGVINGVFRKGLIGMVYVDETRPLLQGARLTAWELKRNRVPFRLICDSMAGYFMSKGSIDAVIVGADRIASNGDTANKIGTYSLAVLAHAHGIPFFIAAPISTIDFSASTGSSIVIEERDADEITVLNGRRIAPKGIRVSNPAFDVTPRSLISAIITERGVITPPYKDNLKKAYSYGK